MVQGTGRGEADTNGDGHYDHSPTVQDEDYGWVQAGALTPNETPYITYCILNCS